MLQLQGVSKGFWHENRWHDVLQNITFTLPAQQSIGVLGRNGAGKSTLLKLAAGVMQPDTGHIHRNGRISWPIGFAGSFHRDMTAAQNLRFLARIHGVDTDVLCALVEEFAELGSHFYAPLRSYSSGMIARLTFGAAMYIRFDTYLIDEVTAVGDARFRQKSADLFAARIKDASALIVSHNLEDIRQFCTAAILLENGKISFFNDVESAIATHEALMQEPHPIS